MRITEIKGIGSKTEKLLNKLGIYTDDDLLMYFPKNYDVYEKPVKIAEIDNKSVVAICGTVIKNPEIKKIRNISLTTTMIRDESGDTIRIVWFNMPFLRSTVKYSMKFIFRGRIKWNNKTIELEQPEIYTLAKYEEKLDSMQPIYALTKGITNNTITKAVHEILNNKSIFHEYEYLAKEELEKMDLCNFEYAINNIHFPMDVEVLKKARKRLVFDEFFKFIYNMRILKENEITIPNEYIINDNSLSNKVISELPYTLTKAQNDVLNEIREDISSEKVMQRLIQGDVGSGKTIIAFLTMFDMAASGLQSVLMTPTEVLAQQHYENIVNLINNYGLQYEAVLLTGSVTAKQKRIIYEQIESGKALIVIGTHAVFQEKIVYNRLALVITDEQHRFGVMQRAALKEKGYNPHVLVMSATPIPRTLAIIMYGDLDISIINEMPAERIPIKNCVVTKDYREKAYKFIENQVNSGRQAYIICPMVEESDNYEAENVIEYADKLKHIYGEKIVVEYLHGKMTPAVKNEIMRKFAMNEINVLVSTTVIEVGINVPNATIMMVENAERFGLASLHQLRGRVGRGKYQSYCIFVSSSNDKEKLKRLDILNKSNDGFYIASCDLKLRGPGDFFGIRQSGDMQFDIADIYTDGDIMKMASEAVDKFIESGNELVDKKMNNDIVIY